MSPQNNHLQRPPAAVLYADELAKLKQNDNAPCPPGWQLSLPAARAFILGDEGNDSNLLIVFYVQIMPDDFVMQLHRF
ncbi:hypothetical protein NB16F75_17500 [Escherichia coli]